MGRPLALLVPESREGGPAPVPAGGQARRASDRITEWEGRRKNGEVFPFELALFEFQTPRGAPVRRQRPRHLGEARGRALEEGVRLDREPRVAHSADVDPGFPADSSPEASWESFRPRPPRSWRSPSATSCGLVRLINDILDLERYDTGRIEMNFETVALDSVFTRSLEAVRSFADQEGVTLETSPASAKVRGDGDRLVQVLVNLLSNAVKFSPRGSTVHLSASREEGWSQVSVLDQGRGIPASFRAAIFERFRQVEASDARQKGNGAGPGDLQGDHRAARRHDRRRERGRQGQRVLVPPPGFRQSR